MARKDDLVTSGGIARSAICLASPSDLPPLSILAKRESISRHHPVMRKL